MSCRVVWRPHHQQLLSRDVQSLGMAADGSEFTLPELTTRLPFRLKERQIKSRETIRIQFIAEDMHRATPFFFLHQILATSRRSQISGQVNSPSIRF
jgi:hypothetical protein